MKREFRKAKIARMLAGNISESTQTEWVALMGFVLEKDKTFWFCGEYRKLNNVTKRDLYPNSLMGERIDVLGKAATLSTIHTSSGCYQIGIDYSNTSETAFISLHESYQFIRMPFRLCKALKTIQHIMDVILLSDE